MIISINENILAHLSRQEITTSDEKKKTREIRQQLCVLFKTNEVSKELAEELTQGVSLHGSVQPVNNRGFWSVVLNLKKELEFIDHLRSKDYKVQQVS